MTRNVWLAMLAKLAAPSHPTEAAAALAAMLPLLGDLPDAAFTAGSLDHVARHATHGCPNYATVRAALSAWWSEHRPPAIANTATDGLSAMDRVWLAHWRKLRANGFQPEVDFAVEAGKPRDYRAHTASLIRQRSPKAWAAIEAAGETGWQVV